MKNIIPIFLALMSLNVWSEPQLLGKWKSSLELSKEFNSKHAKLDEKQINFLNQVFGLLTIEYGKTNYILSDKEKTILVNGKKQKWGGTKDEYEYKVIAQNESKIILKQKDFENKWDFETLHFIDEDTYWIYLGATSGFGNLNIREYFVRIK